jgi:hypothetical protein
MIRRPSIAVTVTNSTLSGNSGGGYEGENGAVLIIINSTVAGNDGYAIGAFAVATATLKGTLLSHGPSGQNCPPFTAVTSQGYNLSDDNSCAALLNQTGDINNTPALLSAAGLQNNGGPTQTIAPQFASPAVNAIPAANCFVTTDQRGVSRPQGLGCDIGAVELVLTPAGVPALSPLTMVVFTVGLALSGTLLIRRRSNPA